MTENLWGAAFIGISIIKVLHLKPGKCLGV